MLYVGDPWQLSFLQSKNLTAGHYYKVENVLRSSKYLEKYDVIQVEDTSSHKHTTLDPLTNNENWQWVVLGYYEKMKNILIGKSFKYKDTYIKAWGHKRDGIIRMSDDSLLTYVENGSIWKCVDISVRPRTSKDWQYVTDGRSTVVMVVENPKYGQCYCYLENSEGRWKSTTYEYYNQKFNSLPLIAEKFIEKTSYDNMISSNNQDRAKRLASLTKRFGKANAQLIIEGNVKLGMTREMCRESWGSPSDINTTVGSYGKHEQWVYNNSYLYFENGKLTDIQY